MRSFRLAASAPDAGERLDRFIARAAGVSRLAARRAIDDGSVFVDGRRVRVASRPVRAGQVVAVTLDVKPPDVPGMPVLFEDDAILAVDKPAWVATQPTRTSARGTAQALAESMAGATLHVVHRLDRETSGVLLFAKTKAAAAALGRAFSEGAVEKRYLAAACGWLPDRGTIEVPLSYDRRQGRTAVDVRRGLPARTRFKVRGRAGDALLAVELWPETGRTHQLRAHLAAMRCPVLGDRRYGGPSAIATPEGLVRAPRAMLHAESLALSHPATGGRVEFHAPPPSDLAAVCAICGA